MSRHALLLLRALSLALLWSAPGCQAQGDAAAALRASHQALQEPLKKNTFNKPLVMTSVDDGHVLRGEVHARIDQPFAAVAQSLAQAAPWCDVLILHLNVKSCRVHGGDVLSLRVGRKFDQAEADAYPLDFAWRLAAQRADYVEVTMAAPSGPMGTHDYRIEWAAVPLDARSTWLRMSYAYGYGLAARLAMQGYLATVGAGKVGFTVLGTRANGQPEFIGGSRGVLERNTMRYYLALDAFLGAVSLPAAQQADKRLTDWIDAVERFPLQLHDMERQAYLDMKHKELARQKTP